MYLVGNEKMGLCLYIWKNTLANIKGVGNLPWNNESGNDFDPFPFTFPQVGSWLSVWLCNHPSRNGYYLSHFSNNLLK